MDIEFFKNRLNLVDQQLSKMHIELQQHSNQYHMLQGGRQELIILINEMEKNSKKEPECVVESVN